MLPVPPIASQALPSGLPNLGAGQAQEGLAAPHALLKGDAAAFEQAAGTPIHEVQAASVQDRSTLGGQFSSGLQDLSVQLAGWQKAHAAAAAPAVSSAADGAPSSLTKSMADAVAGMQGAYAFAIETTLASRGSTELTKVFNTLLKGQ